MKALNEELFRIKNLMGVVLEQTTNTNQTKVQSTPIINELTKISQKLPSFLDRAIKEKANFNEIDNNKILSYVFSNAQDDLIGDVFVYNISAVSGIPVIASTHRIIIPVADWRKNLTMNNVIKSGSVNDIYDNAGSNLIEKFNKIWNSTYSDEISKLGITVVKNNAEFFKTQFLKISRSKTTFDQYWKDNPQTYSRSNYFIGFVSKINGNAKEVLTLIQDNELLNVIDHKTKNFKSNGEYPELKYPQPV